MIVKTDSEIKRDVLQELEWKRRIVKYAAGTVLRPQALDDARGEGYRGQEVRVSDKS